MEWASYPGNWSEKVFTFFNFVLFHKDLLHLLKIFGNKVQLALEKLLCFIFILQNAINTPAPEKMGTLEPICSLGAIHFVRFIEVAAVKKGELKK